MLNNLVFSKRKSLFKTALNNELVPDEAIVFIEDTKEIYTHGLYFGTITMSESEVTEGIDTNARSITAKLLHDKIKNTIPSFFEGINNVISTESIPVTKRLCICTTSVSNSLSLDSIPEAGREIHIIINNTSTSTITIVLPNTDNYVCLTDTALSINAGQYAEVNIISDGSKMYIRSL